MVIPYNLEKGLLFEDTNTFLPWAETLEKIKTLDNPLIDEQKKVIGWKNKERFGGKIVDVVISVNNYKNENDILEVIDFSIDPKNPWIAYKEFSTYFKKVIGQPSEYSDDGYGRPTELWNFDDLQVIIGVGERFLDFEIFSISKGEKRWTLQ